jgi:hypothetical protein
MVIWTHSTDIYLTKFKPIDRVQLIGCSNLIGVGTTMVPVENNPGSISNIKSSSSLQILKWKS